MLLSPQDRLRLEQQDATLLPLPLSLGPHPHSMAAHARHLLKLLRDPAIASPSAAAMAHLAALYDRTVTPRTDIACRKGCAHCCSQPVLVSAPEAFALAGQLRHRPDRVAAVTAAVAHINQIVPGRRWQDWMRCPLLEEEACSVYAVRPLGCHGFVSLKLDDCLAAFVDRTAPDIAAPSDYPKVLHACRILLYAVFRLMGVRNASYEMNAALAAILAMDDAEARWLKGEDVLAGLEDKTPIPPQFESAIASMAAFVAPTL